MTIQTNASSLASRLNAADPNTLADMLRTIGFGSVMRRATTTLRRQKPSAQAAGIGSVYDLATLEVLFLPDDAKAFTLKRVYARAGGGATGELTIAANNATPTTGQVAVTPAGNIAFLGSDAYTDVDVVYDVADQDVVELGGPPAGSTTPQGITVASNQITIPVAYAGVAGGGTPTSGLVPNAPNNVANAIGVTMLLEAEAVAGTSIGKKVIIAPGSAPAAGQAALDATKSLVKFNSGDGVTLARVKLGIFRAIDMNALLEAASNGLL